MHVACGFAGLPARLTVRSGGPPRRVWRLLCLRNASEFTRRQCFIVDFLAFFRRHIPQYEWSRTSLYQCTQSIVATITSSASCQSLRKSTAWPARLVRWCRARIA